MAFIEKNYKHTFTILAILLILSIFTILLYSFQSNNVELEGKWGNFLFQAMFFYLIIIFIRTIAHLILCFANAFFTKSPKVNLEYYPLVSVLIPCYNEELVIKKAIKSALKLSYPNYEIIIIDDGSNDSTLDIASALVRNGKVRIINQENGGKAKALNRGIEEAFGEYFLCMDADSLLSFGAIELGISKLIEDENLGAVAGTVEIGNAVNSLTRFQKLEYIVGLNLFKVAQSFLKVVTVIPGPIGLFRKSIVQEVGGYKTNTYAEDCELTLRILMAGYGTIYIPEMVAVTEAPEDLKSLIAQRYRWSRGVVQAIRENFKCLLRPDKDFRNFLIILYMNVESIVIPCINFLFAFFTLEYALYHGRMQIFGNFFLQLTFLDVTLTVFCIAIQGYSLNLIFYSIFNRVTYGLGLEILRFLSIIDEVFNLPMSWAKLARKGLDENV